MVKTIAQGVCAAERGESQGGSSRGWDVERVCMLPFAHGAHFSILLFQMSQVRGFQYSFMSILRDVL